MISDRTQALDGRLRDAAEPKRIHFDPNRLLRCDSAHLERFACARRQPIVIDLLTLVAAVSYADRLVRRGELAWSRRIHLVIPVYDLARWNRNEVTDSLVRALAFLTVDNWAFSFVERQGHLPTKPQESLSIPRGVRYVIPYSDGLDSRSTAYLVAKELGGTIMRVRVGSTRNVGAAPNAESIDVAGLPFEITERITHPESSGRARGFKYALISAVAAYLAEAANIIMPESGQGVFGPAILKIGQCPEDHRNHPRFTKLVEEFVEALLSYRVSYEYPRLWSTKGETLRTCIEAGGYTDWAETRSCWMNSHWCSVDGVRRDCGVCAACILRRQSVHAAGLFEEDSRYVVEDLRASRFEDGIAKGFVRHNQALLEYAIAGVREMGLFAALAGKPAHWQIKKHATLTAPVLSIAADEVERRLHALALRHEQEWSSFLTALGRDSFVHAWAEGVAE